MQWQLQLLPMLVEGEKVAVENIGVLLIAIDTTIIDETIVVGTERLRIPKYSGIKLIPAVATAKGTRFIPSCIN